MKTPQELAENANLYSVFLSEQQFFQFRYYQARHWVSLLEGSFAKELLVRKPSNSGGQHPSKISTRQNCH
jgi:hypothetical protein